MSTSKIYIWLILALCAAKGGCEVFYKKRGQNVIMSCGDAVQNYDVEWKHNERLILRILGKSGRRIKGMSGVTKKAKITGTVMEIPSLGTEDAGVYSCTGYNKKGEKTTMQHTLHIVSVITSPADVVLYSTEVTLTCDIPEDSAVEVQWLRPPELKPFRHRGKTVTLNSVNVTDAGHWACQIKDEMGVELKISVDITVVGPLKSEDIVVLPGDTAQLPCSLPNASRLPIIGGGWVRDPPNGTELLNLGTHGKNLHWISNMSRIMLSEQHPSTNFGVMLTNVQSADAGVYMCTLTFEGGNNLSARLNLKVEDESNADVPDPLVITASSGGTAELPCSHPGAGHPRVVGGRWTHKHQDRFQFPVLMSTQSKGLHWNGTGVLMSKVTFTDKQLNTNFNVTLHNVGSADTGVYVCSLMFEDGKILNTKLNLNVVEEDVQVAPDVRQTSFLMEFWQRPLLGVSMWVWAAAAGGIILLSAVVIVIVLIQKKRKKSKNKLMRQKRETTKVHSTTTNTQQLLRMQHETERQPRPGRRQRPAPPPRTQYHNVRQELEWTEMSVTQTHFWISLALCLATGGSENIYEKSGNAVTLDCGDALSNKDIDWKHNDQVITKYYSKSGRISKGSAAVTSKAKLIAPNLQISSLDPQNSGLYSCTGYDNKNSKITKQYSLSIVSVTGGTAAVVHSELTLTCDIAGDSQAVVQWLRPDSKLFAPGKELNIKSVSLDDAGKWTCQIKDKEQEKKKIEVDITVVGFLESSKELSVNLGGDVELPCCLSSQSSLRVVEGGWARDPPTNYLLTLDTMTGLRWNSTQAKTSRFKFQTQTLSTNFSVRLTNVQSADAGVYMCTLMFEGKKTLSVSLTLKVVGKAVSVIPQGKTFWEMSVMGVSLQVWVGIVTASVLLIMLIVIIVIIHRRNKRMKRKVRKLKSMREPLTPRNYCQCNR
ncbi:CD4-2 molecule, tandem duplicate 2 [Brachyhypopomus gauderio]|uniref:CD4-2 molecule, tandem duplicate 2 n=1 Tax=Brachyhypopomus gauderio TaxID=698409 RepID=UPI0040431541